MKSLAIEREFGSGGREIGMHVAELAGIPYYDSKLLMKSAETLGVPVDMLEMYDEQRTGSLLYDIAAFSDIANNRKNSVYELFDGLRQTTRNLASQGPAVFIGRCSSEILYGNTPLIRAFIFSSDIDKRLARISKAESISLEEAKYLMQKKDRDRKNYFRFWSHKDWGDLRNYDLALNTASISPQMCVHLLLSAITASN